MEYVLNIKKFHFSYVHHSIKIAPNPVKWSWKSLLTIITECKSILIKFYVEDIGFVFFVVAFFLTFNSSSVPSFCRAASVWHGLYSFKESDPIKKNLHSFPLNVQGNIGWAWLLCIRGILCELKKKLMKSAPK